MANPNDTRIPLTLLKGPEGLAAWLAEGVPAALIADSPQQCGLGLPTEIFDLSRGHRIGCACCAGRSPAAVALDRLFQARIRGTCAWFERVGALVLTPASRLQVRAALSDDPLTLARFRLSRPPPARPQTA